MSVYVFVILNDATTIWKSLCYLCGCMWIRLCVHYSHSAVCCQCYPSVIIISTVRSKKASHTNKWSHRAPPKRLTVSIARRHENPRSPSLFEPTSQVHLHSSNLPNTFCSFCSLFQCLVETEMHNISVMVKERHNVSPPHLPASAWQNTECIPGSAFQRAQVHYGNCSVVFTSHSSVLWASHSFTQLTVTHIAAEKTHAHTCCLADLECLCMCVWPCRKSARTGNVIAVFKQVISLAEYDMYGV